MKLRYCIFYTIVCIIGLCWGGNRQVQAQNLLNWSPDFIAENNTQNIVITANANKGNMGLLNYTPLTDVYVHVGVITTKSTGPSNWKYVSSVWATTTAAYQATSIGNNQWTFTLPSNLRTYFNITDTTEHITKIAILFRSGNGNSKLANSDNSDMYIPVSNDTALHIKLIQPPSEPRYIPWLEPINIAIGQNITVEAATNKNATISFDINNNPIGLCPNIQTCSSQYTITQACYNSLQVKANQVSEADSLLYSFYVAPATSPIAILPTGVEDGINYESGDTSVVLVLYAPVKTSAILLGDFNNFLPDCSYQMNQTPDGTRFWFRLTGLTPNQLYQFQYLVDGTILTTDPYTELVLDPWNDNSIPVGNFPNLPVYPSTKTSGIVGTFQTGQIPYNFSNFTRPAKENLVVYETLLRDFVSTQSYTTLKDTLPYLKQLGINCIELMPVNEFEGNNSWGYNPDFYFALDKNYGTKLAFQDFVERAHQLGIAVVVDAVLNHVTGLSPLAQLYWNGALNQAAPNNPWLNDTAKHPFNVFNDMNHASEATKYHTARYIRHWLTTYNIDGFRWDLSKGFTQVNYGSNVSAWSGLDTSRIRIWKRYYDTMQSVSAGSYCILEHLGADLEESQLAAYGMLLWGKMTDEYAQNSMGYSSNSSINRAYAFKRSGYTNLGVVTYAESHDEERLMYKNLNSGNVSGSYNIKILATALKRQEAIAPFLYLLPGPKMIWQFGELGYDYGINYCTNGTYNANCRLDPKPIKWNYLQIQTRKRLYEITSVLLRLRNIKPSIFSINSLDNTNSDIGGVLSKKMILKDNNFNVVCIGNFDVTTKTVNVTFPHTGTWYNYVSSDSLVVNSVAQSISLSAGAYKVYIDSNIIGGNVVTSIDDIIHNKGAILYPNPTQQNFQILIADSNPNEIYTIHLVNVQGQLIRQWQVKAEAMDDTYFDMSTISTGKYWVKLSTPTSRIVLSVIKQ